MIQTYPQSDIWVAFSPTATWTTNATSTGLYKVVRDQRGGDTLYVRGSIVLTGATNNVALNVSLPTNFVIDTSKFSSTTNTEYIVGTFGEAILNDTGTAAYSGKVRGISSTTLVAIQVYKTDGTYLTGAAVSSTVPHTWGNTDFVTYTYSVPCKAV